MVPPAFPEVELVLSHHYFHYFPAYRHDPDEVPVATHDKLQVPAEQVGHEVNIPDVDPDAIHDVACGAIGSERCTRLPRLAQKIRLTQVIVENA